MFSTEGVLHETPDIISKIRMASKKSFFIIKTHMDTRAAPSIAAISARDCLGGPGVVMTRKRREMFPGAPASAAPVRGRTDALR